MIYVVDNIYMKEKNVVICAICTTEKALRGDGYWNPAILRSEYICSFAFTKYSPVAILQKGCVD